MNILSNTSRAKKRVLHHLLIPFASLAFTGLFYIVIFQFYPESTRFTFRLSLVTSYAALLLLAITLTLGAQRILTERANPVSNDLRRDTGIWCAVFSLIHVGFGLNVHLQSWTQYFFDDKGKLLTDAFGLTNYLGVVAALIVVVLLITSNDVSLKYFGLARWKSIQRWNYVFVFLVIAHGFIYQFVEKRLIPYAIILGVITLMILLAQLAGFNKKRREVKTNKTESES